MSNISEEEQIEVTNTLKEDIASGISGISYRLIKKVSSKVREYLVEFANKVICEEKFVLMTKNQKQMLNKLLECPHNKIIIDRVLVQSKNKFENKKLVMKSDNIKKEVVKHFKEQFRKRNYQFETID